MSSPVGSAFFDERLAAMRSRLREEMFASASHARLSRLACDVVGDVPVARRIEALGFGGPAARLFDLIPLVEVAWADGKVQRAEREAIMEVAAIRGFAPDSPAAQRLAALLEQRPSEEFFAEARSICADLVKGAAEAQTVLSLCRRVAEAAGGMFGLATPVSRAEARALQRVAASLGAGPPAET